MIACDTVDMLSGISISYMCVAFCLKCEGLRNYAYMGALEPRKLRNCQNAV